ncbi:MAG: DUF4861 family protein, partial [Kiritimatiellae bacterium]|nr:DUF4861 family protein [Kiritimatiellia bacterium]
AGEREEAALRAALPGVFERAAAHYRALDADETPLMKDEKGELRYPHGFKTDKRELKMYPVRAWTSGHFPGSLWYLYEATGDAFFKDRALAWTEIVASNSKVTSNHDVGFIMFCSFGNARRLLKTDRFDALLVETAESLSSRFNESIGLIRSWGKPDEDKNFLVIPDNMMNLELLEEASKISGNDRYAKIARSHADVTMKHHFRADGGCYHVLNYDQRPGFVGAIQEIRRGQGLGCESAWSRGQSWAIYGYTMMYRETKNPAYLAFAQKLADFAVNNPNMPADGIPCWDYGAPGEERDSSAGAIMASALLELSGFVPGAKGAAYRAFAVKQLLALSSPAYFSDGDEVGHFLLKHGVGAKPVGSEIDVPLNYGDYYFLEALLRFSALSARSAAESTRVDARYIPERMDDFLWENGFAAFRVYGPKLALPKPEGQGFSSNGIDVFNKGVADVCGAETILAGVQRRVSYHADNGRCFDSYTVGPGAGCGGVRRRTASGEWQGDGNWRAQRVVEMSAARAVFELEYEAYTLRGTVTADSPFVRFDVTPKASGGAFWGPGLDVAPSRGHEGAQLVDVARGALANAETASGTLTAVVVDPASGAVQLASDASGCLCLLVAEKPFTYYAAAAWRGMGVFPTAESWFACVRAFADSLK